MATSKGETGMLYITAYWGHHMPTLAMHTGPWRVTLAGDSHQIIDYLDPLDLYFWIPPQTLLCGNALDACPLLHSLLPQEVGIEIGARHLGM
jgi:hypothetical protein